MGRTELALNCGLKFLTPEEFFLNKPPMPFVLKGWDPSTHDHDGQSSLTPWGTPEDPPTSRCIERRTERTDDDSTPAGPLFSPTSSPLLPRRNSEFEDEHPPEVVIFVGFPGSGKTSFYKTHFAPKGYVHVVRFIVTSSCLSPELCADLQFYLLDSRFLNRTKTRSARARPAST